MCVVAKNVGGLPCLVIEGRKGLKIIFDKENPEMYLLDKSLVGLEGKKLKQALKKPFFVSQNLYVVIEYEKKGYSFIIKEGYDWNGSNVPPFLWLLIGQQKEPRFK